MPWLLLDNLKPSYRYGVVDACNNSTVLAVLFDSLEEQRRGTRHIRIRAQCGYQLCAYWYSNTSYERSLQFQR